jgi:hypothetical protein
MITLKQALLILKHHNITLKDFLTIESWGGVTGAIENNHVSLARLRTYLGY